jgi:hypothetical protein
MLKSKKTKTIKKRSNKCIYTDETKRIIKITRIIRKNNKKTLKNIKPK